jgi:hypothetical protein
MNSFKELAEKMEAWTSNTSGTAPYTNPITTTIGTGVPWGDITSADTEAYKFPPWTPPLTDLQQCIRDCLRLATYAGAEMQTTYARDQELARLAGLIQVQVQKELDAWKALMGGETSQTVTVDNKTGCLAGPQFPSGSPGSISNFWKSGHPGNP